MTAATKQINVNYQDYELDEIVRIADVLIPINEIPADWDYDQEIDDGLNDIGALWGEYKIILTDEKLNYVGSFKHQHVLVELKCVENDHGTDITDPDMDQYCREIRRNQHPYNFYREVNQTWEELVERETAIAAEPAEPDNIYPNYTWKLLINDEEIDCAVFERLIEAVD